MYIYEDKDWPRFELDLAKLAERLAVIHQKQGRLLERMDTLGFNLQQEAVLKTLTEEIVKSSEIEGAVLDAAQVRSSIARRLGMDIGGLKPPDRNVEGVVEMMLDATRNYKQALTTERLFAWHAALFPTGRSGLTRITVGGWRDDRTGPMQVISGPVGKEYVHYEAPAAAKLATEMDVFLTWFNGETENDWVVKAGLAHLWFVTIHPLDDGNGRVARAIADMALARSERSAQRFYSMSAQIRQERGAYYEILEEAQKGTMNVTPWMDWFLSCLERAMDGAETTLGAVLGKARFWDSLRDFPVNERQRTVLNRLLDGFEEKLTSSKWAKLTKSSHDTALRDIAALLERGVLVRNPGGGRSTSYALARFGHSQTQQGKAERPS
jgi:Fic family protein